MDTQIEISSDTVNPVLLPTHHHLTNLVIKEVHSKMMHGGVASTLTAIRDNYWIPRGREVVKGFIRHCVCTKHGGKPFPLFTPPSLPEVRVDDGPPWTNTGVDYAGPMFVIKAVFHRESVSLPIYMCFVSFRTGRRLFCRTVSLGLPSFRWSPRSTSCNNVGQREEF